MNVRRMHYPCCSGLVYLTCDRECNYKLKHALGLEVDGVSNILHLVVLRGSIETEDILVCIYLHIR